jgi:hypothetical protein
MRSITIENPDKIGGLVRRNHTYMISYLGRNLSVGYDNYSWDITNEIYNVGRLTLNREIVKDSRNRLAIQCLWNGNEIGEALLNLDTIKDMLRLKQFMINCIDGYFDK